ncbi:SNF2 family N-terminal domain-containing protein [Lyophyllum atratum]|nr:SNF2 family N-terminal domain-containing protein [Lyophyllum atratum]
MGDLPLFQLLATAKTHLGYSPTVHDQTIPNAYLEELKRHTMLYPHDMNYQLTLEPRRGYGKVTCLEQGCNAVIIPLVERISKEDGGLAEGLGSLSAYRHHIAEHPTHAAYRDARIKAELAVAIRADGIHHETLSRPMVKKERFSKLLDALDRSPFDSATSNPHAGRSSIASPVLRAQPTRPSSLVRVKPEPSEAKLPAMSSSPVASSSFAPQTPISTSSKHTRTARWASSLVRVKPEHVSPETPCKRLSDVAFGSGANLNEYGQILPLTVKRPKLEETPLKQPLYQVDRNAGNTDGAQSLPGSVEDTRAKISDVQRSIDVHEDAINRLQCKRKLGKADMTRIKHHSSALGTLRWLKETYTASLPSVSPIKRTLSKHEIPTPPPDNKDTGLSVAPPLDNPAYAQPGPFTKSEPVASGSNIRLPGAYPGKYEDDMDVDDADPDKLSALAMQHIGPIIPMVAPVMGAENYDINGDYHGRGRDTFVGPQAKADDIDKFLLEAGNAEQFDGNARLDQALEKLGLQSQYDLLPGMEVALMPHQTIGVAWMIAKEKSTLKGGCLGDDMGLGKTVQMIATLIKNPSTDPIRKTNLIITPTALLDQWKLEIQMKTNCDLKCLIYHGSSKPKRKQDLLKYDVVLTTYSTMALEWPDFEHEMKKKAKAKKNKPQDFIVPDSDEEANERPKKKEQGLLFQVEFYRIILDEAQAIRNRRTRTSRAVTSLQSTYRWCLTGTPIINSLVDIYGYVRFLKVRPWYDFKEFQHHIGALEKKRPTLAVSRLQTVIATFLLRRMKDSKLDGKRLIELPEKTVSLVKLQFSDEERAVYEMVEAGAQANFNRYLKAGTVLKNYSQVLVLLLRLRQICSHPSLIQEGAAAFISPDEADDGDEAAPGSNKELARARRLVSPEFVTKMKSKFKTAALQRIAAEKESADAAVEDEECPICFDALTDAVITPCTHVFCRDCLVDVLNTPVMNAPEEPAKYKPNERPCPGCRSAICSEKLFARDAFLPSDADLLSVADTPDVNMDGPSPKDRKGKGKARPKRTRHRNHNADDVVGSEPESSDEDEDDDLSDFIVEDDEDEEEKDARRELKKRLAKKATRMVVDSDEDMEESPEEREVLFGKKPAMSSEAVKLMPKFLPSTKMKCMMKRLEKLVEERPDEKTLVVSQWTGCLSLVSDYLTEKGVIHVKYQGDMNRSKRDQAVRVFMSKDKARVMLMSLKCGGVGLNLTRANNVISLDLGWSQAIEAQSFDRVHRLGQTRPVVVQRLVISDTVEDRVLAMQERKQLLADGSLGEGSGKKIGRLSVRELANLFGLDHRGQRLIQD